ncbi:MAG: SUMF1/EgtB/PvdO family nonheme iron enzyme [Burkholderiales bacterium]|nr:SUMF1/EgtB/PvdO family nonheme iron enzyme [Burkholderiales bacterium]
MRQAGAELLSLALIDARNLTLRWLAAFEPHLGQLAPSALVEPPLWLVGQAGWFQEYWVARNVQRQRGEAADRSGLRLASIDARADACFDPSLHDRGQRWRLDLPDATALRQYLAETLEGTLDLLAAALADDDGMYVFRLALWHEDRVGEALAAAAQALQLPAGEAPWLPRPARAGRDPLWFGAQRVTVGSARGGLVPPNERWAHEVALPEFEIDAQAVSWARYAEFVADGGYDEPQWWSRDGWAWVQAEGRRAPRYVEQMRQAVLVHRQGELQRVGAAQAAVHVSRHEAEAWCRWAGRRLPTEPEWELAALQGGSRGFVWGDVFEWVLGSARPYPGGGEVAPGFAAFPEPGRAGVLRGGSWMTRARQRHPRARRFVAPYRDELFAGFRSCAA